MTIIERGVAPEVLTEREQRARTLEAAALEIEVRGWARGHLSRGDGSVCLVGGILVAKGEDPRCASYSSSDEVWWGRTSSKPEDSLWSGLTPESWNDAGDRTADDVTFLLRWRAEEIRDGL